MPSPPTRQARAIERAYFVSDLHLHGGDPGLVERARAFVAQARADGADALFLLGDVFRALLGARSLRAPGLAPFLDELRLCVASGMRVVATEGNHDFMLEQALFEATGVESPGDQVDVSLGGRRARLLHGDAFCTLDADYHRLHAILRSGLGRWLIRTIPPSIMMLLALGLIRLAERRTSEKDPVIMDIVDEAVQAHLEGGVDVVVCGHVHRARDAQLGSTGRLVVLADFESTGSHAVYADGELTLVPQDARFAPPAPVCVTIDGPAGSGKSAVARALAQRLGFSMLDSGALYRAVTACALSRGVPLDPVGLGALVDGLAIEFSGAGRVAVDGFLVPEHVLRGEAVTAHVSQVSSVPAVRAALLPVQRGLARGRPGIVAEGRDMGTVVFPDAAHRFFLQADPEVRARRRLAQNAGEGADLATVHAALMARDERDSGREVSPLRAAPGAEVVETSDLTLEQVVDRLEASIRAGSAPAVEPGVA